MMNVSRQTVFSVLRAGVGMILAGILLWLTLKSAGGGFRADLAAADKRLLVGAVLLYGFVLLLTMWRWDLLLRVQGVRLRFRDIARLTMIGFFFNLTLPGAVSGDLVKMAFVIRRVPEKSAECILTIMLDRILGILGLFFLASLLVFLNLPFLLRLEGDNRAVQIAAFLVGFGSLAGIATVLLVEFREKVLQLPGIKGIVNYVGTRLPGKAMAVIRRLTDALDLYRRRRGIVVAGILLSVMVHCCLALDLYLIGHSLGEHALSLRQYFLATQVANAVAAVPVTPAGLGLRDFGIKLFFKAMEATPGTAGSIPVSLSLVMLFWALVGAAVLIFQRSKPPSVATSASGP